jgi:hypothetical protein
VAILSVLGRLWPDLAAFGRILLRAIPSLARLPLDLAGLAPDLPQCGGFWPGGRRREPGLIPLGRLGGALWVWGNRQQDRAMSWSGVFLVLF